MVPAAKTAKTLAFSQQEEKTAGFSAETREFLQKVAKNLEIVQVLAVGEGFGELALISSNAKRNATAVSLEDCQLFCVGKSNYDQVLSIFWNFRSFLLEFCKEAAITAKFPRKSSFLAEFPGSLRGVSLKSWLFCRFYKKKPLFAKKSWFFKGNS